MAKSHLEQMFRTGCRMHGLEPPQEQFKAVPHRKFRWDFHFPAINLVVDIQGGVWSRGDSGHNSGSGLENDYEKLNLTTLEGFSCFFVSEKMMRDSRVFMWIKQLYEKEILQ